MRAPSKAVILAVLLCAAPSVAATSEADHAAAVESFRRGTQLVEAGRLQDAIDAFRGALQREPGSVGARLDLADCYEKVGAPASAWREYAIAEAFARRANDPRQEMARTSAAGLEGRLLVVRLVGPTSPETELRIDGDPVAPEITARASIALAPGRHRLEVTGPGKRPMLEDLSGAAGETRAVTIALEEAAPPPVAARPIAEAPRSSAQKTWGLVLGAAGLAGVAAGAVFGGVAIAKKSALETEAHDPSVGSARFYGDRSSADAVATVSTVSLVAGAAALVAGVTLVVTAPASGRATGWLRVAPSVTQQTAGCVLEGAF